jgi:hypothetical protein
MGVMMFTGTVKAYVYGRMFIAPLIKHCAFYGAILKNEFKDCVAFRPLTPSAGTILRHRKRNI